MQQENLWKKIFICPLGCYMQLVRDWMENTSTISSKLLGKLIVLKNIQLLGKGKQKQYLSMTKPTVPEFQALYSWCSLLYATGFIWTFSFFFFLNDQILSNIFIVLWAKYWLPAVPGSLLCATETSLIPIDQFAKKLPACVHRCTYCLHSFASQVS